MRTPASPPRRTFAGRRLVVATVASLALHSLLFHGLTRLQLGDITPSPLGDQPTSPRPQKPKRRADFSLRVPKTPTSRRAATEKPLDVPLQPPQPLRQQPPPLPPLTKPMPQLPPEQLQQLARDSPARAPAQPPRAADVEPLDRRGASAAPAAPMAVAPVDRLPSAPLTSLAASPQPLPATLPTRGPVTEPFVGRWQPREALLLERLAAGSPPQPNRSDPALRRPAVTRVPRAGGPAVAAVGAGTDTNAAPLPAQPPAAPPQPQGMPIPRPRIGRSRLAAAAGSTSGGLSRSADRLAAATANVAASGNSAAEGSAFLSRQAVPRPERAAGMTAESRTSAAASVARRGDLLATAAAGTAATAESLAGRADTSPPAAAAGGLALGRPAPAALSRLATLAGRRPASASIRRLPVGNPADAAGTEEGLSVSSEELRRHRAADGTAAGRQAAAGPSLERIAAAALPADGRVRDVADAFASRLADRRMAAATAKVADREALIQADAMIERGLEFLARSQQADGRWSLARHAGSTPADAPRLTCDTAATGLALLSFLGAGHDHFAGPYRDVVRRGIEWLLAVQQPNGDLYLQADPLSNSCGWMYSHAIATMALCEAVGMTGDPLLRPAADKACQFISASQHASGGWRYVPGTDSDLSVSGWMLVALRAGALAGVPVDPETFRGVRELVERSASAVDPTRYTYNPRDSQQRRSPLSVSCMTAVGALMRLHTGVRAGDRLVARPAELLVADSPSYGSPESRRRDAYLWYYASQVLVHTGGAGWDRWYRDLVELLAEHQQRTGPAAGSWDPLGSRPDRWGHYGGRIYVTALHLLALEVPARHLPTYSVAAPNP